MCLSTTHPDQSLTRCSSGSEQVASGTFFVSFEVMKRD